jgi:hypothetical protein
MRSPYRRNNRSERLPMDRGDDGTLRVESMPVAELEGKLDELAADGWKPVSILREARKPGMRRVILKRVG